MPKQQARARVAANLIAKNKAKDPYYLTLDQEYQHQIARTFRPHFDSDEQMLEFLLTLGKPQLTKARARPYEAAKAWKSK